MRLYNKEEYIIERGNVYTYVNFSLRKQKTNHIIIISVMDFRTDFQFHLVVVLLVAFLLVVGHDLVAFLLADRLGVLLEVAFLLVVHLDVGPLLLAFPDLVVDHDPDHLALVAMSFLPVVHRTFAAVVEDRHRHILSDHQVKVFVAD